MTGQKIYELYTASAAQLPVAVTKGEALPAWAFLDEEVQAMWNRIAQAVRGKRS